MHGSMVRGFGIMHIPRSLANVVSSIMQGSLDRQHLIRKSMEQS